MYGCSQALRAPSSSCERSSQQMRSSAHAHIRSVERGRTLSRVYRIHTCTHARSRGGSWLETVCVCVFLCSVCGSYTAPVQRVCTIEFGFEKGVHKRPTVQCCIIIAWRDCDRNFRIEYIAGFLLQTQHTIYVHIPHNTCGIARSWTRITVASRPHRCLSTNETGSYVHARV